MNPSIIEGPLTGMFVGDYLQAVTPKLALGVEAMLQRPSADEGPTTMLAYAARYKSKDWVASGQLLAHGAINTSYWRRLSSQVEAGVDLNLQFAGLSGSGGGMMGQMGSEGAATLGAKYEFRTAIFRGQVDSKGKVSCVLEKMVSPPVQLTFAGELDHAKVSHVSAPTRIWPYELTKPRTPPKSALVSLCRVLMRNRWSRSKRKPHKQHRHRSRGSTQPFCALETPRTMPIMAMGRPSLQEPAAAPPRARLQTSFSTIV